MHEYTKYKIKCKLKEAGKFVLDNKVAFLQMGIMAAVVFAPDIGFCNTATQSTGQGVTAGQQGAKLGSVNTGINSLNQPLQMIGNALTGPIPAVFTIVSGAVGGLAWGMGWEQQITQRALKCVGGGAVAMGAGSVLSDVGIDASACLIM